MKTKSDFIKALLAEKNLRSQEREKIIQLGIKEIGEERDNAILKVIDNTKIRLHADIEKLESKVDTLISENKFLTQNVILPGKSKNAKTESFKDNKRGRPKYFNPYWTYKFLQDYNQNPILKSTCHEIDTNEIRTICKYCETTTYNFKSHLNKILEEAEKHIKKNAPPFIKAMILAYLTGKDIQKNDQAWSEDNIKINWRSESVLNYSKSYKIPPNLSRQLQKKENLPNLKIDSFKSKINGSLVQNFRELTLHFKNLIHIRSDNSLKSVVNNINRKYEYDRKIDFIINDEEFPTNIELFTDVDKVTQAYNEIINLIITIHQTTELPKVQLKFFETEESVKFSIHHLNSIYRKSYEVFKNRPIGQVYENLIKNQIHGVMNFYLKAELIGNQHISVNLYNGKKMIIDSENLPGFQGVEHIFEFKKKR